MKRLVLVVLLGLGSVLLWLIQPWWGTNIGRILTQPTLIVLTNEAELRPCGGFITGVGHVDVLGFEFELGNVYRLPQKSFGPAPEPLASITNQLAFWDKGTDPNPHACGETLREAYAVVREVETSEVLLVDIGTIEWVLSVLGPIEIEGEKEVITAETVYGYLSREAANTDRHDEGLLQQRKSSIGTVFTALVRSTLGRPSTWGALSRGMRERMESYELFYSAVSPVIETDDSFSIIEWNAGGGKSSRYLQKSMRVVVREVAPKEWQMESVLTVDHLGQFEEPLSMDYKGGIEVQWPHVVEENPEFVSLQLAPGESWEKRWTHIFDGQLPERWRWVNPRGHRMQLDFSVSVIPQQRLVSEDLDVREHVGVYSGNLTGGEYVFDVEVKQDRLGPFVTLHEVVPLTVVPESLQTVFAEADMILELHWNEDVVLQEDAEIRVTDRDYHVPGVTEHPEFVLWQLLPDRRTLLVGVSQYAPQREERYFIELEGVTDRWGNGVAQGQRTIIDRRS